jgi:hypothetical protein
LTISLTQTQHRYAVCWPSLHPQGGQYWWYDPKGTRLNGSPSVDDLPDLPEEWLHHLEREAPEHHPDGVVYDPAELWQGRLEALAERCAD